MSTYWWIGVAVVTPWILGFLYGFTKAFVRDFRTAYRKKRQR